MGVSADTASVTDASPDDLREELRSLEAEERRLSAERDRLHDRIDLGYATDTARTHERQVSDARRKVHERIDSLRKSLADRDPL